MAIDRFRFYERNSGFIEGDIVDENDDPVPLASLISATLTLYDIDWGRLGSPTTGIINGRYAQDVLNANDVTIETGSPAIEGHFVWSLQPEDNTVPDDTESADKARHRQIWRHRAMFVFAWVGGEFRYECEIEVVNLRMAS